MRSAPIGPYGRYTDYRPGIMGNGTIRHTADFTAYLDYRKRLETQVLPSHGRGHWFDPSTAHHKSMTCETKRRQVREGQATGLIACMAQCVRWPIDQIEGTAAREPA